MENEVRNNLEISGAGSASGGVFGNVLIEGTAKITGDIDCLNFNVDGVARVHGNITAKDGRINGVAIVKGAWHSDGLAVSGFSKIAGDIAVKRMSVGGFSRLDSNIAAEEVEISGHVKIKGDCQSETFTSRGVFHIGGMLNAGDIDVLSPGGTRVREIGGEKVTVRGNNPNILTRLLASILFHSTAGLVAETIEADDVYLEYSTVQVVRGNNVRLGPGCHIDLVEYRDVLERNDDSQVKELKKTGSG
ncbi:MAG: cell shape determination protein CcmA [Peptococcaceae bacterium]|jgi:cytoskeletal protein CcmA (bactofilin family)|nr:cell shape determination protein CcmA [Peptococcaceae bacterium]